MQAAWAFQRPGFFNARMFARDLRQAWHNAKAKMAQAMAAATMTEADRTRAALSALENKDTWTQADYARAGVLRAAIRAAVEHEQAANEYTVKRDLIQSAGGRFCAVTFTKADGSERTRKVQPATLQHHVKGDDAAEPAQRAVATRKARHPHLLPVWDAEAKAPRSVNLATVTRIAVDGQVHRYAA
jgi:hypothetical protein